MKRIITIVACALVLTAGTMRGQESPVQLTVPDSSKSHSTAIVETSTTPADSETARTALQQEETQRPASGRGAGDFTWLAIVIAAIMTPLIAFVLTRLPRPLFSKDQRRYCNTLRKEQGQIKLVGPGMDDISVSLDDTFVHLRISGGNYRVGEHPELSALSRMAQNGDGFTPDELLKTAFVELKRPLLLVIGDPGSGKTTLIKYYAIRSLAGKGFKKFGFKNRVLPVFLPLREVDVEKPIAENLKLWCAKHHLSIKAKTFDKWLQTKQTLVLFDGLDEVRDAKLRRRMCTWIDNFCRSPANAYVIVTSRPTGYRGRENVVLQSDLLQADIHDFTPQQREEFLRKWFAAAYLRETHLRDPDEPVREWKKSQRRIAEGKAKSLLDFLNEPKNKSLRELSGIPMLLQIMAILWKKDDHLPKNRSKLYEIALDYLLEYRDAQRKLDPLLPANQAQRVLSPACLWMQEKWQREEVPEEKLHDEMGKTLKNIPEAPTAQAFCDNLRRRAGILAHNSDTEYIFRHKSFREFFAGLDLATNYNKKRRLQRLAKGFFDDWWEEPLRFFISKADGAAFNQFMAALFKTPESEEMDAKYLNRLITLAEEAPLPQISALARVLQNPATNPGQHFAVLECLKAIGTPESLKAVEDFVRRSGEDTDYLDKARQILREKGAELYVPQTEPGERLFKALPKSFYNPLENNAEYLLIRGGKFKYSVTDKMEEVPDIYFAKYPVTNARYRRFIRYLQGEEKDIYEHLPFKLFGEKLLDFAATIPDYREYLGSDAKEWADKLKSGSDDERKFNKDDQPVVSISWFAARAYCFWLALFETAKQEDGLQQPAEMIAKIYRLPHEMEWERAAAGLADERDAPRPYPWGKKEPNDKLANYGGNRGATTTVGHYREGETPDGLMDMAGNVWEWQENWHDEREKRHRSLRGGSWGSDPGDLACAGRGRDYPDVRGDDIGFRVVRSPV